MPFVGALNAISYLAWAAWLVLVGVVLLGRPAAAAERVAAGAP